MTTIPRRAFWRTDSTHPTRSAALRRAAAVRWSPTVIERGLAVKVERTAQGHAVLIGANSAALLIVKG